MGTIRFDYSKSLSFFGEHEMMLLQGAVQDAHYSLHEKAGKGNEYN